MNLANKLTLVRIVLIPFFLAVFYIGPLNRETVTLLGGTMPLAYPIGLVIFLAAAVTDFFDGHIARKYNMITDFGKFMDPLADKLLVTAALLVFVERGQLAAWIVFVILAREFMVTGFRTIAASKGIVMAAGWSGKIKTVCQFAMIAVLLLGNYPFATVGFPLDQILIWLATFFTILSGTEYLWKNIHVLK